VCTTATKGLISSQKDGLEFPPLLECRGEGIQYVALDMKMLKNRVVSENNREILCRIQIKS
jgi:hypothetical protein